MMLFGVLIISASILLNTFPSGPSQVMLLFSQLLQVLALGQNKDEGIRLWELLEWLSHPSVEKHHLEHERILALIFNLIFF